MKIWKLEIDVIIKWNKKPIHFIMMYKVKRALREGKLIKAIKIYRDTNKVSLKEAHTYIRSIQHKYYVRPKEINDFQY